MHSSSRVAYSSTESNDVKIDSLYLDGAAGKIVATIDERMLSLEAKTGHALDIKLHSINRVHHHHTRLVPGYIAAAGLALIWSSIRIFSSPMVQAASMLLGIGLTMGWAVTRKPTLTIDTEVGDCHVITGNDFSLLKVNTILMKLQRGFSLSDAVEGLELLEGDTSYPRSSSPEQHEVPVSVVEVSRPESIASFLSTELAESVTPEPEPSFSLDAELFDFEMPVQSTPEPLPSWLSQTSRPAVQNSHAGDALIQRGINNVTDRRERQSRESMPMFNALDIDLTTVPTHQNNVTPNRGIITQSAANHSEAGPAHMPELLPSFWNRDGYHNPNEQSHEVGEENFAAFSSPDQLLGNIDENGELVESLVATARRSAQSTKPLTSQDRTAIDPKTTLLRRKAPLKNSRLIKKKGQTSVRESLRNRLVPSQIREAVSSVSNRILSSIEQGVQANSTLRERSNEAMEQELESFSNLAKEGLLPDEKVRELEETTRRRKAIIEQNQQELADHDGQFSWGELIDSEEHHSSTAGKGGLPRIDL